MKRKTKQKDGTTRPHGAAVANEGNYTLITTSLPSFILPAPRPHPPLLCLFFSVSPTSMSVYLSVYVSPSTYLLQFTMLWSSLPFPYLLFHDLLFFLFFISPLSATPAPKCSPTSLSPPLSPTPSQPVALLSTSAFTSHTGTPWQNCLSLSIFRLAFVRAQRVEVSLY